jgi:hypothetical protein
MRRIRLDRAGVGITVLRHSNDNFFAFVQSTEDHFQRMPPILMTQPVLDGFRASTSDDNNIKKNLWQKQLLAVHGYGGAVFWDELFYPMIKGG